MPVKTPIYLKTTTPKKGKKLKLRDVLSGDMISPPLGDVRHSAHVGPEGEGDMFGDVGFLRGKMDMLPLAARANNGDVRSHSVDRQLEDTAAAKQDSNRHDYSFNGFHYEHSSSGLLKSTISMPVFVAHEQAPPKPPRLHLDDPTQRHLQPANVSLKQHPTLPCHSSAEPCRDVSVSPTIRRLVPSSGSFSEASSEESMSDTCGPLDAQRGLSLDSDAGLSNEDLRSDRSDSPCGHFRLVASSSIPRSDSMVGLDLDLGPSILEDVLRIMDRYKNVDHRCEL
ncbi:cdc42 effector protein 2 [Dunckerocampus dactyliophorus]|uniref:cdc42 effector protein 2 n=1 Tax=Dunckerocampus dactyliophorus TaxID=161453 RepID=UPI002405ED74|nr:cdc42 effector protein 2 [Dunckerocampus dactyliophorus]XP_054651209.1 cdc42 effector protein 2 [Dunckerocampus dactyliophorus]XP_054651210.1 cdc42 effector protein 2 [Dunckerocampus dactyliophorus]